MVDAIPDGLGPELSQHERQLALRLAKALRPQQFEVQVVVWRTCIEFAAQVGSIDQLGRIVARAEGQPDHGVSIYGPRALYGPVPEFDAVGYPER